MPTAIYYKYKAEKIASLLNKSAKETAFELTTPKIDKVKAVIIASENRKQTLIKIFDWLIKNKNTHVVAISDLNKEK